MDFGTLINRLGRNGQIFVGGAVVMLVDLFLPWYKVSIKGNGFFVGVSGSTNAWHSGLGAWFPTLLLIATGVVVVLAALGTINWAPLMTWTVATGVSVLSVVIILLRWLTFKTPSGEEKALISAGASFGTFVALIVAIVMAVFAYLAFAASGGDVKNLGAGFQNTGQTPPAEG